VLIRVRLDTAMLGWGRNKHHLAAEEMRHFSDCNPDMMHVLNHEMANATGIALLNHERKWSQMPEAMVLRLDIDELEHPWLGHHIGPCQGIGLVRPPLINC
jgi:hypothetical protein